MSFAGTRHLFVCRSFRIGVTCFSREADQPDGTKFQNGSQPTRKSLASQVGLDMVSNIQLYP